MSNANDRMIEVLNSFIPKEGTFSSNEVAQKVRAYLDETEPELRDEWLEESLDRFLRESLSSVMRRRRQHVHRRMKAGAFSKALESRGEGNSEPLNAFQTVTFAVDENHTRKRLGEMTGSDFSFVAQEHEYRGNASLLLAQFHRALARKVGTRTLEEVMTETEYAQLYQSIVGI